MQIINVMGASIDGRIASHPNESDAERKRYGFTNKQTMRTSAVCSPRAMRERVATASTSAVA